MRNAPLSSPHKLADGYVWERKVLGPRQAGAWFALPPEIGGAIEDAHRIGRPQARITVAGREYKIDFKVFFVFFALISAFRECELSRFPKHRLWLHPKRSRPVRQSPIRRCPRLNPGSVTLPLVLFNQAVPVAACSSWSQLVPHDVMLCNRLKQGCPAPLTDDQFLALYAICNDVPGSAENPLVVNVLHQLQDNPAVSPLAASLDPALSRLDAGPGVLFAFLPGVCPDTYQPGAATRWNTYTTCTDKVHVLEPNKLTDGVLLVMFVSHHTKISDIQDPSSHRNSFTCLLPRLHEYVVVGSLPWLMLRQYGVAFNVVALAEQGIHPSVPSIFAQLSPLLGSSPTMHLPLRATLGVGAWMGSGMCVTDILDQMQEFVSGRAHPESQAILLRGHVGGGKSVSLLRLALSISQLSQDTLVFYIPCRSIRNVFHPGALKHFLATSCRLSTWQLASVRTSKVVLLLDDMPPSPSPSMNIIQANQFAAIPDLKIVVTTSYMNDTDLVQQALNSPNCCALVPEYCLALLDPDQVSMYLGACPLLMDQEAALRQVLGVEQLMASPLMLSLIGECANVILGQDRELVPVTHAEVVQWSLLMRFQQKLAAKHQSVTAPACMQLHAVTPEACMYFSSILAFEMNRCSMVLGTMRTVESLCIDLGQDERLDMLALSPVFFSDAGPSCVYGMEHSLFQEFLSAQAAWNQLSALLHSSFALNRVFLWMFSEIINAAHFTD
eukprot:gene7041-1259_t